MTSTSSISSRGAMPSIGIRLLTVVVAGLLALSLTAAPARAAAGPAAGSAEATRTVPELAVPTGVTGTPTCHYMVRNIERFPFGSGWSYLGDVLIIKKYGSKLRGLFASLHSEGGAVKGRIRADLRVRLYVEDSYQIGVWHRMKVGRWVKREGYIKGWRKVTKKRAQALLGVGTVQGPCGT